ncbi:MAG TPA: nicotinamide riboside transporter PnuC [Gemmataceae bacterium]|jgi:nicotinamide mononucleotide transporter|nr:nicotinamide riboside transporter PnuC [Gemmataceae bacterium]
MGPLDITAAVFGVLCVALYARQNIWSWPTGLVQVGLSIYLFYTAKLYADVGLYIIFFGLQLYGWYHWARGTRDDLPLPVVSIRATEALVWLVVAAGGIVALGHSLVRWTDAALPFWDSAIAVLSLIAQYLLARKVLENWLVWMIVDVLGIGVYWTKDLHAIAILHGLFLVLAVYGYVSWKRALSAPAPG